MINDKGFQLPARPVRSAREIATKLLMLSQTVDGQPKFSAFADRFFIMLGPMFATMPNKSLKVQWEHMW